MQRAKNHAANSSFGVGFVVVAVIVVLSVFMAPDAHWVTYVLAGLAAACAYSATTAAIRRRDGNQATGG